MPVDITSHLTHQAMSYLTNLGETLATKLSALPEAERDELIAFVKSEVLTSYRNGQNAGDKKRPAQDRDERSSTRPQPRRNYKRR